ncbi:MAG: hypothetical protein ISR65_19075 [Bacteriovoracaceae bacterium]|nr:hypothetical protein [Bacteriovoracaceae bacterium]
MEVKLTETFKSLGEAHLYLAVAKAFVKQTADEGGSAYQYTRQCNSIFDLLKFDSSTKKVMAKDIKNIIHNIRYRSWRADNHLEKAIRCFKQARSLGYYNIEQVVETHRQGLGNMTKGKGHLFKEPMFVYNLNKKLSIL